MRSSSRPVNAACFPLVIAWLTAFGGCVQNPSGESDEFEAESRAIFDGATLAGWTQRGGKAKYAAEEGCIVGRSVAKQPNSFLCTEATYSDFELRLEFKVDPALNSGIQIRSESRPDYQNGRVHGYQVEIDPSDRAWTAGLYDEGRRGWLADLKDNEPARRAFRQGEWNSLRIVAVGDTFSTWINGVPAVRDFKDSKTGVGFIGLQVHDVGDRSEPLEIRWRNIRIRTLGAPRARSGE